MAVIPTHKDFLDVFNRIAPNKHRYTVFTDFVTMFAISLHNAVAKDQRLEEEYLRCIKGYQREDQLLFPELLGLFVGISDSEPYDNFGQLFMTLGFSEDRKGQFFTPPEVSGAMAMMTLPDLKAQLEEKAFITIHEPACGAGSMLLACVKLFIQEGFNPAHKMWIQAIDIDRVSALMCYIQLTLWHVPAEIIVGNALTLEYREHWFTPSHYIGEWNQKLALRELCDRFKALDKITLSPKAKSQSDAVDALASVSQESVQDTLEEKVEPPLPHPKSVSHIHKTNATKKNQISFDF